MNEYQKQCKIFENVCDAIFMAITETKKFMDREGISYPPNYVETVFNKILHDNFVDFKGGYDSAFRDCAVIDMDMIHAVNNKYFDRDNRNMAKIGEEKFYELRAKGLI